MNRTLSILLLAASCLTCQGQTQQVWNVTQNGTNTIPADFILPAVQHDGPLVGQFGPWVVSSDITVFVNVQAVCPPVTNCLPVICPTCPVCSNAVPVGITNLAVSRGLLEFQRALTWSLPISESNNFLLVWWKLG